MLDYSTIRRKCDAQFAAADYYENGTFHISDAPGLGVDFDEGEAKNYTCVRGYHPVVRLEDGTLWNY